MQADIDDALLLLRSKDIRDTVTVTTLGRVAQVYFYWYTYTYENSFLFSWLDHESKWYYVVSETASCHILETS